MARTMLKTLLMSIAALLAVTTAQPGTVHADASSEVVVIVHKDNAATTDTVSVDKIFLRKTTTWDSGSRILVYALPGSGEAADLFRTQVLAMAPEDLNAYWARLRTTEGREPPTVFELESELFKAVSSKPGAIGYVSRKYLAGLTEDEKAKVREVISVSR